jgi:hypothetical protein
MRRRTAKQAARRGGEEDIEVMRYERRTLEVGMRARPNFLGLWAVEMRGEAWETEVCLVVLDCTLRLNWTAP